MRRVALMMIAAAALLAGCGKPAADKPASTLTEAQRDTVLSRSDIPGAPAVGRAMDAAGNEATRAAGMDTLGK